MRIHFKAEGGFAYVPGLSKEVDIDTATLHPEQAELIESAVHDCAFFDLPAHPHAISRGADYRIYVVTIEEGSHSHTVEVPDVTDNAHLRKLITALRSISAS